MTNKHSQGSHNPPPDRDPALYRPSVGIALFNHQGLVFVGERLGGKDGEVFANAWQMPQGGIDEGEAPETAVFREMEEEIGSRNARILGMMEEWLYYDLPPATAQRLWNGKYKGQRQKWIALEFLGDDTEIRLDAHSHPEFKRWQWAPLDRLLELVVPFKQDVYKRVIEDFKPYANKLQQN